MKCEANTYCALLTFWEVKFSSNVIFCIGLQHENCYCDLTDVTQVQPLRTLSRRLDTKRCWMTGRKVTSD